GRGAVRLWLILRRGSALILRSAPTLTCGKHRSIVRASRRMRAASCFETHRSAGHARKPHRHAGAATLLSMRPREGRAYFSTPPHFCSIARASARESAEVGGNCSIHANGRHASVITFECEGTPGDLSAREMRGSNAQPQGLRTMSICSDGSQRVATAHITSLRLDGSMSSYTTTMRRAM